MLMASPSDATIVTAVVSALGGSITAGLTFIATRRRYSGSVDSSNAEQLWSQVNGHILRLDREIAELKTALNSRDAEVMKLRGENTQLVIRVNELELELKKVQNREAKAGEALLDSEGAA